MKNATSKNKYMSLIKRTKTQYTLCAVGWQTLLLTAHCNNNMFRQLR